MKDPVQHLRLVRERIEFELGNTKDYIDFVVTKLREAEDKEREEQEARDRAIEEFYGDDFETGMDIEHALERQGGSPDEPYVPYSPLYAAFPRAVTYSCALFVCLVFEGEAQVLCNAIADWRGVPPMAGTSAFRKETFAFLKQNVGEDTIDPVLKADINDIINIRNCIAHAGGRVDLHRPDRRRDALERFARTNPRLLSIYDYLRPGEEMLALDPRYCTHSLHVVARFFDQVFNAMSDRHGIKWESW